MRPGRITPDTAVFAILSFEGPDRYSRAGGLATRVTELAGTLAESGYDTHLFFVGSPNEPGAESQCGGKLTLHRWCQWISKYYPDGVYQGEEEKLNDFNVSLPLAIRDEIVVPAAAQGKVAVVLGEEWHTAETLCRLSDILYARGLRDDAILLWNANNTYSFHRINWGRLSYVTTILTVSKFMKHVMWSQGINPIVVPNGIPARALEKVDGRRTEEVRRIFPGDLLFFKIGRFDPDKRWIMAVEAMGRLKAHGLRPTLVIRGGIEPHEGDVLRAATKSGLRVADLRQKSEGVEDMLAAFGEMREADIINIKSFLSEEMVRLLYSASDGVLANSGFEPFGLVGLEAMAAGGLAYTGCTGEDYAVSFENAVVVETDDPEEIARYAIQLLMHPPEAAAIRAAGRQMAEQFVWTRVLSNLTTKLDFVGQRSGALSPEAVHLAREIAFPAGGRRRGARRPKDSGEQAGDGGERAAVR